MEMSRNEIVSITTVQCVHVERVNETNSFPKLDEKNNKLERK